MYEDYTVQNIKRMKLFHILGISTEIIGLVLGEIMFEVKKNEHSINTITPQHVFMLCG